MTTTISIANKKGGVAKTTTAINVAYSLTREKLNSNKVLLIDLDSQTNATDGIGFSTKIKEKLDREGEGIYKILESQLPITESDIYNTGYNNLDILPAVPRLANSEIELLAKEDQRAFLLQNCLNQNWDYFEDNYDYIIIDTNPSIGLLVYNALVSSDYVLVPVIPDKFALDGFHQIKDAIENVNSWGKDVDLLGMVITKVDKRTTLEDMFRSVLDGVSFTIFDTVISQNVDAQYSQMASRPILEYKPNAKSGKEYLALTEEIIQKINNNR